MTMTFGAKVVTFDLYFWGQSHLNTRWRHYLTPPQYRFPNHLWMYVDGQIPRLILHVLKEKDIFRLILLLLDWAHYSIIPPSPFYRDKAKYDTSNDYTMCNIHANIQSA